MSRNSWRFVGWEEEEEEKGGDESSVRKECESWEDRWEENFSRNLKGILRERGGGIIITKTRRRNGNRVTLIVRLGVGCFNWSWKFVFLQVLY